MADFLPCSVPLQAAAPDPDKHVNYGHGMVLGVDDYTQEFTYLAGRLQWLARDLLGYGVVRGLRVERTGTEVKVTAGAAITPAGQLVCVPVAQKADLNTWVQQHGREVDRALGGGGSLHLPLYLTLKYQERLTDDEPIPGRPCRDEALPMLPSRVQDDFLLEVRLQPPPQNEEDAVRDFVAWLRQVQVTTVPGSGTPLPDFLQALRQAAHLPLPGSPPSSPPTSPPDYMYGSPPVGLRIPEADLCEYLDAAFRLWVAELRSLWAGRSEACVGGLPSEDRLLLATLQAQVAHGGGGQWTVVALDAPDADRSPYLVHTRLLQEWLLCGWRAPLVEPGDGIQAETSFGLSVQPGSSPRYAREDHTHGTPTLPTIPAPSQPAELHEERSFDLAANAGTSDHYARADHTHGTPTLPPIPAPAQASELRAERTFGLAENAGSSDRYARADHTHGTPDPPAVTPSPLIAAGRFKFDGSTEFSFGDLSALQSKVDNRLYLLRSKALQLKPNEIVKGTPINALKARPATFEVLTLTNDESKEMFPNVPDANKVGIVVRVSLVDAQPTQMGFMVEISRYE